MNPTLEESIVAKARELAPLLREHAGPAEQERRLPKSVVAALNRAGMTRMFMPKSLGGLETDPVTFLRVAEEIASADAAAAWFLMVSNSPCWFFARFPDATVESLFKDPDDWIVATAFQPPVAAREVEGGYRITGRRPFASGVNAARSLMLTAIIMDGERPRLVDGRPQILCAVMPTREVEIIDTWHGMGLRGSDSNDVSVKDLFIPHSHTCPLVPPFKPGKHYGSPLYRLPAMAAIVLATLPPIAVALARKAVDAVRELSSKRTPMASAVPLRDRGVAQERLGRAEGMLRSARALMLDTMQEVWARAKAGEMSTLPQKADVLLAATHTVQTCVEVIDAMFLSSGSSAVFVGHPLEKIFRDSQILRQHGFVCAARYETCSQVFLGLEPDLPFLHF
ncbi:MAG TPA: acyl-CoA dehydrogenase family protein [Planctomycetota bacterium]|nr:acyl-CoA dehydrogenase family protein [Planctomycetota bacterium]